MGLFDRLRGKPERRKMDKETRDGLRQTWKESGAADKLNAAQFVCPKGCLTNGAASVYVTHEDSRPTCKECGAEMEVL